MGEIPIHKLSERIRGGLVFLNRISQRAELPKVDYAHRDDYYLFLFVEKGSANLLLDFEELTLSERGIYTVLPGQVHLPLGRFTAVGWVLAVDGSLVKEEYRARFEEASLFKRELKLSQEEMAHLSYSLSGVANRLKANNDALGQIVLYDLLSYLIGELAELYQEKLPPLKSNRLTEITSQFKALLSANYQTMKRPAQYAAKLNISPGYLNEVVKESTGLSVTAWIQQEIMVQAKRLLYHTTLPIKEVAIELGYEDWAYFTRLFTKLCQQTPSQFRENIVE